MGNNKQIKGESVHHHIVQSKISLFGKKKKHLQHNYFWQREPILCQILGEWSRTSPPSHFVYSLCTSSFLGFSVLLLIVAIFTPIIPMIVKQNFLVVKGVNHYYFTTKVILHQQKITLHFKHLNCTSSQFVNFVFFVCSIPAVYHSIINLQSWPWHGWNWYIYPKLAMLPFTALHAYQLQPIILLALWCHKDKLDLSTFLGMIISSKFRNINVTIII